VVLRKTRASGKITSRQINVIHWAYAALNRSDLVNEMIKRITMLRIQGLVIAEIVFAIEWVFAGRLIRPFKSF
jgi:hypothetical protein